MKTKKSVRRPGKGIYFRVDDALHARLLAVAKQQHRRTIPDLLYAKALELAESAEPVR